MKRLLIILSKNPFLIIKIIILNFKVLFLKRKGIKTLVYNMHYDYLFCTFESLYKLLAKNSNIRIFISYKNDIKLKKHLQNLDLGIRLINNTISPFINFDLFITAEITGPDFPMNGLSTKKLEIYHGTGIYNLYDELPVLRRFDIHFAIGKQYQPEFFEKTGLINNSRVYEVGYPKTDAIVKNEYDNESLYKQYNIKGKPIILYAPHWNEFSSIHALGSKIISKLSTLNVNIIVKVHNYIFTQYPEAKWEERLRSWEKEFENVHIMRDPDTQSYFNISDMIITDVGTTAALEYSLIKKPLFIYKDMNWFKGKDGIQPETDIVKVAITFIQTEEIFDLVDRLLFRKDKEIENMISKQKIAQQKLAGKYFFNIGTASKVGYEAIIKELGIYEQTE
ncbi:MAG: hypothetical protein GQ534_00090 [Candidatus Delongbacteria bacterium]|nr:hypothetical protein [Candidatus Delongbacteria bacterium]